MEYLLICAAAGSLGIVDSPLLCAITITHFEQEDEAKEIIRKESSVGLGCGWRLYNLHKATATANFSYYDRAVAARLQINQLERANIYV